MQEVKFQSCPQPGEEGAPTLEKILPPPKRKSVINACIAYLKIFAPKHVHLARAVVLKLF